MTLHHIANQFALIIPIRQKSKMKFHHTHVFCVGFRLVYRFHRWDAVVYSCRVIAKAQIETELE